MHLHSLKNLKKDILVALIHQTKIVHGIINQLQHQRRLYSLLVEMVTITEDHFLITLVQEESGLLQLLKNLKSL